MSLLLAPRRSAGAALLAALLALAACGSPPALQPAEVISKAVTATRDITSMHFLLDTNKLSQYPKGLFLLHAEGDVARPDRLRATAKALLVGSAIEVQVVGVGSQQFMTDPASNRWQAMPAAFNVLAAFDPNKGIADILAGAKDPQNDGSEQIGGVDCYRLKTTLSPTALQALSTEVNATAPLPARLWIGSTDFRPRQVELDGPIMSGEPANIVRTITFSHFNEPVHIVAPTPGTVPQAP